MSNADRLPEQPMDLGTLIAFCDNIEPPVIIEGMPSDYQPEIVQPETIYGKVQYEDQPAKPEGSQGTEEIYDPEGQIQSMKAVSKILQRMGIGITWTSFHRYCMEQAKLHPGEVKQLLEDLGLERHQLSKVIISYVPMVIEQRLLPELLDWVQQDKIGTKPTSHFFKGLDDSNRTETLKFIVRQLEDLCDHIRKAHGHPDNVAYLRGIYENALLSFSGAMPHRFSTKQWMDAINASHDALVQFIPQLSFLYVSRRIAQYHGERYTSEKQEQGFQKSCEAEVRKLFGHFHLGPAVIEEVDKFFHEITKAYRSKRCTQATYVHEATEGVAEIVGRWCDRAFKDIIGHGIVMDRNFCDHFKEHFGCDIWKLRFQIAKNYEQF